VSNEKLGQVTMRIDIPTKSDFFTMAEHIVNEDWGKIAHLAYDFRELDIWNSCYKESEYFSDSDVRKISNTIFTLIGLLFIGKIENQFMILNVNN
jgi:hypothetical protein